MTAIPLGTKLWRGLARLVSRALLQLTVAGIENVPRSGGVLLLMNHLGGADPVLVVGHTPRPVTIIGKSEIFGWPLVGPVARAYGMIPVRRGEPDRATLARAVAVIQQGGALLIAPEGRESKTGALERAKEGPAFIAQHSRARIVPIAITGTEWPKVTGAWRRLRRPCVTLTYGESFELPAGLSRHEAADSLMRRIARLLPPQYRGVYSDS